MVSSIRRFRSRLHSTTREIGASGRRRHPAKYRDRTRRWASMKCDSAAPRNSCSHWTSRPADTAAAAGDGSCRCRRPKRITTSASVNHSPSRKSTQALSPAGSKYSICAVIASALDAVNLIGETSEVPFAIKRTAPTSGSSSALSLLTSSSAPSWNPSSRRLKGIVRKYPKRSVSRASTSLRMVVLPTPLGPWRSVTREFNSRSKR